MDPRIHSAAAAVLDEDVQYCEQVAPVESSSAPSGEADKIASNDAGTRADIGLNMEAAAPVEQVTIVFDSKSLVDLHLN